MLKPVDAGDLTANWGMVQDEAPAIPDSGEAWGHVWDAVEPGVPMQVAGIGGPLGRAMGRGIVKATQRSTVTQSDEAALAVGRILGRVAPSEVPDTLLPPTMHSGLPKRQRSAEVDPLTNEAVVTEHLQAPPQEDAPINTSRAHPGASAQDYKTLAKLADSNPVEIVRNINSAEDFGVMLNGLGKYLEERPRSQNQVAREASLDKLYEGIKTGGLLNDRQLFALRSLVATLWDQYHDMSQKIDGGDHTPEILGQYLTMNQTLTAMIRYMKGQTRETARALAQQRMVAQTLDYQDINGLEEVLRSAGGGQEAIIANAKALADKVRKGKDAGVTLSESINNATLLEALVDMWKSNNLSAMATQTANAASSLAVSLLEHGQRGLAAGIGETRAALGLGAPEHYTMAEFTEASVGATTGLYHSLDVFMKVLLRGESDLGARAGKEAQQPGAVHQVFGSRMGLTEDQSALLMTPAYRVMQATDEAIMLPTYLAELSALAARDGVQRGLKGEDLRAFVDNNVFVNEPPFAWREQALEAARKVIMQQEKDLGLFSTIAEPAYRFVQSHPLFGFVAPWIRTPARILDYSLESTLLMGQWQKTFKALANGGPEADMAAGKIVSAVGMTGMFYGLISAGMLTGAGPEDPEQRAAMERAGWQQYSIRIGNTYYSYRNWGDPLVGLAAGMATGIERAMSARTETGSAQTLITAAFGVMDYMLSSTYLEGFQRLYDAAGDSTGRKLAEMFGAVASGFIPLSAMQASVARTLDDRERAKSIIKTPGIGGEGYVKDLFDTAAEQVRLRLPGLRDEARPRRYWDGSVMMFEEGAAVRFLSPLKMRSVKDDPASRELVKHGTVISEPRSRFAVLPSLELDLIDLDSGTGKIYDEYIKEVGQARRMVVEEILASPDYHEKKPGEQRLLLDRAMLKGLEVGRAKMIPKILDLIEDEMPRIRTRKSPGAEVSDKLKPQF